MNHMTKAKLWFALAVLSSLLAGIAIGYNEGIEAVHAELKTQGYIVPCDSDLDCLEKNGCGGYGNPCEEEKETMTIEPRTEKEIEQIMEDLQAGQEVDLSLHNGIVRSSKHARMQEGGYITVWHDISDAQSNFSQKAFIEVLRGDRDIWDGDLTNDDEDEDEPEQTTTATATWYRIEKSDVLGDGDSDGNWQEWQASYDPAQLLHNFVRAVSNEEIDDVNLYWRVSEEQTGSDVPESQRMDAEERTCSCCQDTFTTQDAFQWWCPECSDKPSIKTPEFTGVENIA